MAAGKFRVKVRGYDAGRLVSLLAISTVFLFTITGFAETNKTTATDPGANAGIETLLIQSLEFIGQNRLGEAQTSIQGLLRQRPDFRLAHLVLGDLLMTQAGKITRFGEGVVGYDKELADLMAEAKARLNHEKQPQKNSLPGELLRIPASYTHVLVVDLSRSRLYLFSNWQSIPEKVSDYYITIGKEGTGKEQQGDKKTPVGLYHITGRLDGKILPPLYGFGALPLDYPNEWDQLHHRTGSGIWLHGTPLDTYSRPPRASDGCVVLTNPDFKILNQKMNIGYPVILTQHIDWLTPNEWWRRREQMIQRIYQWRDDWTMRQGERILRHYSSHYQVGRMDDAAWNRFTDGNVSLMDPGLMEYPGDDSMMVVTWNGWQATGTGGRWVPMTQYWRFGEDSDWKIVFEPNG